MMKFENVKDISQRGGGSVDLRGKVFTIIRDSSSDCYINRDQPTLNIQPKISLSDYYSSHTNMKSSWM